MLSSVDLLWPSSWPYLITHTSCSRCRVPMAYSPFEVTSSAHMTATRKPSRSQPKRSKPMKHRRLPTLHNRLSRKTWRFRLRRWESLHHPLRWIPSRLIWVLVIPLRQPSSTLTFPKNRNSRSPTFSGKTWISSHGSRLICRVFQESWLSTN